MRWMQRWAPFRKPWFSAETPRRADWETWRSWEEAAKEIGLAPDLSPKTPEGNPFWAAG